MCGICGAVQIGGEPRPVLAPEVLDRMTDAMVHRGPNDRGTYADPGVALGARRLSIVDVDGGHQPFGSEDGLVWAAQNGELYNHVELRSELERDGHVFRSRCDTEILPHLYERDGPRFVECLRGKFAIAVWDGRERRAVLARDRLGIKPLYYASSGDLLLFASELKALLASGLVATDLDYEAIDAYLTLGFVPGPRTPLAAVSKLEPGHRLIVDGRGVRTEAYWTYPEPEPIATPLEECAERLLAELDEAVRLRLMSDVPLGAMLSGGLDSSVVVALMARHMSEPVKTFSVGFREAGEQNELADARYVSELFGTEHHELELSFAEETVDLARLVWHLDEPLADLSALGFLGLSELAAQHVTVALSGQGADELLGGYRKHRAAAIAETWLRLPRPLTWAGERAARMSGRLAHASRTLAAADPASRLLAMSANLGEDLQAELSLAPLPGGAARRTLAAHAHGLRDDPLAATLYLDAKLGLVDDMLHYFDRASMAHSLEVRVPFLDHRVVEYCASIPSGYKVRRLRTKHVLKEAAAGILPAHIIDKPKVGFFNAAVGAWFQAQMRGAIPDYLLAPSPRYADLLDRRVVERLVREHGRDARHSHALLSILMLEVWLSEYLPRAVGAPAARPVALPAAMRSYAVVSPVRDEADNLPRLAASLDAQTVRPAAWIVVDNGSTDGTANVASELVRERPWMRVLAVPGERAPTRGAPVVRAFRAGLETLPEDFDVVVKLDADVSVEPDYFERVLREFRSQPSLGITSGTCFEQEDGEWLPTHVTEGHVRGAARAYRRACLEAVGPLYEGIGWDGVDSLRANALGWKTATLSGLPFYHHRRVGERDRSRWRAWAARGSGAHYMGYRFSYLLLRALRGAARDPSALAMIGAYGHAVLTGRPRCADSAALAGLRRKQRARNLPLRMREALGRRGS